MAKQFKTSKPILLFYLLVTYVLLQFFWWAYLLLELNAEIVMLKQEILLNSSPIQSIKQIKLQELQASLHKRWMMVAGEGIVFLSLLTFGIYKTKQAVKKEVSLASQQKNFLLSITHEFKSPLASIKLNLQTLQKRQLQPEQKEDILIKSLLETERIHVLIENALMASRLESRNYEIYFEPIDFTLFITELIEDYKYRRGLKHELIYDCQPQLKINGDKFALTSMITNLIENAEKYSEENSKIEITLKQQLSNGLIFTIKDAGQGIPEQEKLKVIEKFYRIGNEDTRKTKGTGLGLFIVKQIVDLHKGTLMIKNNSPKGTIFEITLPLIQ